MNVIFLTYLIQKKNNYQGFGNLLLYLYKEDIIMKNKKNRYILITKDLQKNLIEFLDEIQLEAAKLNTTENMHIVNFCSYAIEELLSGFDAKLEKKNLLKRNQETNS